MATDFDEEFINNICEQSLRDLETKYDFEVKSYNSKKYGLEKRIAKDESGKEELAELTKQFKETESKLKKEIEEKKMKIRQFQEKFGFESPQQIKERKMEKRLKECEKKLADYEERLRKNERKMEELRKIINSKDRDDRVKDENEKRIEHAPNDYRFQAGKFERKFHAEKNLRTRQQYHINRLIRENEELKRNRYVEQ